MGCHFLLQGVFPTQGLNPGLLHCRQTLYHLSHQGSSQLYGGVNSNLLQEVSCRYCCTQGPQQCSRPPLIHTSARDSGTLTGKSGLVSCGVTAPFSLVLVRTRFCLCPPRVGFPVLCMVCNQTPWLPKSNSLGVLSPLSEPKVGKML